jgi:acetate kinase
MTVTKTRTQITREIQESVKRDSSSHSDRLKDTVEIEPIRHRLRELGTEGQIRTEQSNVKVLVIPAEKETTIARDAYELTKGN